MDCQTILVGIVIPLISAIIGGAVTFLGVMITIKHEVKKDKQSQKQLYKPYLKISKDSTREKLYCKKFLQSDSIDYKKCDYYFSFKINKFNIINCSDSGCILNEIIINGNKHQLQENLILKNECVEIETTGNAYINMSNPIENIYLCVCDILGNIYYYKCDFHQITDRNFPIMKQQFEEKEITVFMYDIKIINISLPQESISDK